MGSDKRMVLRSSPPICMPRLVIVAVGQVIADVALSTKSSDWAKWEREMTHVAWSQSGHAGRWPLAAGRYLID